jgi:hypothetical protein
VRQYRLQEFPIFSSLSSPPASLDGVQEELCTVVKCTYRSEARALLAGRS